MKTPIWEDGTYGSSWTPPLTDQQHTNPQGVVTADMHVIAKCKGTVINLKIIQEIEPNIFKASVNGDYFINEPEELKNNDEVRIARDYILHIKHK